MVTLTNAQAELIRDRIVNAKNKFVQVLDKNNELHHEIKKDLLLAICKINEAIENKR